ncbi:hypothetical protein [Stratiformator vulcanicus]|uniref:Uncharacterized protein n=1 Tax=Stratiformator vulcanicus TaxID=2527980 RepID=A0A517R3J9_9PLAN|nr:hypothetical protein [Stratiformator vulcanicus]QDT38444.1 hypothetical protein Pan189_28380 [Stratiformator vulcanicus]
MSQITGFVQSAILIVPVVAVPALAMFGPPAGSERYQGSDQLKLEGDFGEALDDTFGGDLGIAAADPASGQAPRAGDAINPPPRSEFELTNARTDAAVESFPSSASNSGRSLDDDPGFSTADMFASLDSGREQFASAPRDSKYASKSEHNSDSLDWPGAIDQLKRHGIERFALTEGSRPGNFYFTCGLPPSGPYRTVRRFEAEAANPTAAVADVLHQLEEFARQ